MRKIISVVGVGIVLTAGGCAQVPSGKMQELESSISQTEGGNFGMFISHGHLCASHINHAKMHLAKGQRVSGKFLNSGSMEIDQGIVHANDASGHCAQSEQAFSGYVDEKLEPLDVRMRRLEGSN